MSKSNTKRKRHKASAQDQMQDVMIERWEDVQRLFHLDLDTSAKNASALVRKREIRSAIDLLRLILLYAVCDLTLNLTGLFGYLLGLGYLSDVAVMERLQKSADWLGVLLVHLLQRRCQALTHQAGLRLRLMDATVISQPGSTGTNWRIHLSLDMGSMAIQEVSVTDAQGGESLQRFRRYADEIWVADRGYAVASGLGSALVQQVWLVVRINWHNLPLYDDAGQRFDPVAWLDEVLEPTERRVVLPTPEGDYPMRLIATPLPPEQAERARAKARKTARRKGHTVSDKTLKAAGFLLVLTNLSPQDWPLARVLWLYRIRWQVELAFKRCKSLLDFDQLRAKDPRLVRTYLLGKLLMALILDELLQTVRQRQPDWWIDTHRPLNVWRLTQIGWDALKATVRGPINLLRILECPSKLSRYLRTTPRARPEQAAHVRAFLEAFT